MVTLYQRVLKGIDRGIGCWTSWMMDTFFSPQAVGFLNKGSGISQFFSSYTS